MALLGSRQCSIILVDRQEPLRLVLLEASILLKKLRNRCWTSWSLKHVDEVDTGIGFWSRFCSERVVFVGGWIWMIARCFVDVHWPDCCVELPHMEWIYFVENMNVDLVASTTIWAQRQWKAWIIHQSFRSVFNCTRSQCTSTTFWSWRVFPEDYTSHLKIYEISGPCPGLTFIWTAEVFFCWELRSEEYVGVVFQAGGIHVELLACSSFLFFTLPFVLFTNEVQDCLFKALGFELSWEFFNETKRLSVSIQTSLHSLFQFWNPIWDKQ